MSEAMIHRIPCQQIKHSTNPTVMLAETRWTGKANPYPEHMSISVTHVRINNSPFQHENNPMKATYLLEAG